MFDAMIHSSAARAAALAAVAVLSLSSSTASAQWTVTNIHPAGATGSVARAGSGGQRVGYAIFGGEYHAGLWNGGATTWTDLNPAGATQSEASGTDGVQQAGYARVGGVDRASLWSGSAGTWVDLHPVGVGASGSRAFAVSDGKQAGSANFPGVTFRACLWSGTAASWVDLHPIGVGATHSHVEAISGGRQAGYAIINQDNHASLWTGTAASWVDLHPAGATYSVAHGISGIEQAGAVALVAGGEVHASVWTGTAGSWVDLHPAGATRSRAFAARGGRQVGYATVGGVQRASLWSATPGSWVDLAAVLPAGFSASQALGVSDDGTYLYVSGYGSNTLTSQAEALLWMRPLCDVAPVVFIPPQAATTCTTGNAAFTVVAFSLGTPGYQWQWRPQGTAVWLDVVAGVNTNPGTGQPAFDASGGVSVSVTMTNSVGVSMPVSGGRREIQVVVSNPCGSATSAAAMWTICPPDFNCSGTLTINDIFDFLAAWFAGNPAADFNGAGGIGIQDIFDFLAAWFAGC